MRHRKILRSLLIFGCFLVFPVISRADGTTSFQLSLFHPVQIYSDDYSVDGFRWNIIYGVNEDFQGVDIGMFNQVKKDCVGLQLGLIANVTGRSFQGLQAAVFFNDAVEEMHGLQIGLINHTGSLYGVQIGLLNFNDDTKYLGFFPFINAAF